MLCRLQRGQSGDRRTNQEFDIKIQVKSSDGLNWLGSRDLVEKELASEKSFKRSCWDFIMLYKSSPWRAYISPLFQISANATSTDPVTLAGPG